MNFVNQTNILRNRLNASNLSVPTDLNLIVSRRNASRSNDFVKLMRRITIAETRQTLSQFLLKQEEKRLKNMQVALIRPTSHTRLIERLERRKNLEELENLPTIQLFPEQEYEEEKDQKYYDFNEFDNFRIENEKEKQAELEDVKKKLLDEPDHEGLQIAKEKLEDQIFEEKRLDEEDQKKNIIQNILLKNEILNEWIDILRNNENTYFEYILSIFNKYDQTHRVLITFLKKQIDNEELIEDEEITFTIIEKNLQNLKKYLSGKNLLSFHEESLSDNPSDVVEYLLTKKFSKFKLYLRERIKTYQKTKGAFFKYLLNNDEIKTNEFYKYGLFNEININNYKDNCLYVAFFQSNLFDINELNFMKTMIKNRLIPKKDLHIIAEKLSCCIHLKQIRNKQTEHDKTTNEIIHNTLKIIQNSHFGQQCGNEVCQIINNFAYITINLGLVNEHYFLNDNTNFTKYAVLNYNEIKDKNEWNLISRKCGKKYQKDQTRTIKAFELFELLIENKERLLKKINLTNELMETIYYDKVDNYIYDIAMTETSSSETMPKDYKKAIKAIKGYQMLYFDIETTTDGKHKPYLCCSYGEHKQFERIKKTSSFKDQTTGKLTLKTYEEIITHSLGIKKQEFFGEDCIFQFLMTLKENTILVIHNAGYDFRFVLKNVFGITMIEKGTKIMQARCHFLNIITRNTIKIKIKDSLCLIPKPLKDFGKCFKLDVKKEILPYAAYNSQTVKKTSIPITYALEFIDECDHKEFNENIEKWGCKIGESEFDHLKYSAIYCAMDCEVLSKGYEIFRKWMLEITNIDINLKISLASLAFDHLNITGCFLNVYELSGVVREFIEKHIVGGRVMTRQNKMWHHIAQDESDFIEDFDGVSLYPSAMSRLGLLKGKPKILEKNITFEELKKYDGYFIEIKITKIGKRFYFPLISYLTETKIRKFTDDIEEIKNKTIYVNRIDLEDLINFHKIEFEIIKGVYFDEGRNYTINSTIERLFNERKLKKKDKNPIQEAFKLIMNAAYGKTILKAILTENRIFDNSEKMYTYLDCNYDQIKYFTSIPDTQKWKMKIMRPIINHCNMPHVGGEILSMSKRIMNEVMCLADNLNIKIYYQDTDSMHIVRGGIKYLSQAFFNKYGRMLIGEDLGQFHCDFDFKSEINPYAIESYFIGKKVYIDRIVTMQNNIKKEDNYHIRCKGVPTDSVYEHGENPMKIYEKFYKGEKIEFNLLAPKQGTKQQRPKFDFNINYEIKTRNYFPRKLQFEQEHGDLKNDVIINNFDEKDYKYKLPITMEQQRENILNPPKTKVQIYEEQVMAMTEQEILKISN